MSLGGTAKFVASDPYSILSTGAGVGVALRSTLTCEWYRVFSRDFIEVKVPSSVTPRPRYTVFPLSEILSNKI